MIINMQNTSENKQMRPRYPNGQGSLPSLNRAQIENSTLKSGVIIKEPGSALTNDKMNEECAIWDLKRRDGNKAEPRRYSNDSGYNEPLGHDSLSERRYSNDSEGVYSNLNENNSHRRSLTPISHRKLSTDCDGQQTNSNDPRAQRRLSTDSSFGRRLSYDAELRHRRISIDSEARHKQGSQRDVPLSPRISGNSRRGSNDDGYCDNNEDVYTQDENSYNLSSTRKNSLAPEDAIYRRRWSSVSFAETSHRVLMLLRATNPLTKQSTNQKMRKDNIDLDEDTDDKEKSPRFSSYMSPEAQFSLFKGYEDILHEKLTEKFPETEGSLKRNKTPHSCIDIRRTKSPSLCEDDREEEEDFYDVAADEVEHHDENEGVQTHESVQHGSLAACSPEKNEYKLLLPSKISGVPSISVSNLSCGADLQSMYSEPVSKSNPKAVLRNLRRLSVSLTNPNAGYHDPSRRRSIHSIFGDENDDEDQDPFNPLRRFSSTSSMCSLPHVRRVTMTHKVENAMDLLDGIQPQDAPTLTPRTKKKDKMKVAPLNAYNSWAADWNKEFKFEHQ